jgi:sugar O-acyltransferase (sialic acid O-acetyltransferase NeuD family)
VRFVVIGAAGQAREVDWYLRASHHDCVGFVVSDLQRLGPNDSRDRVLGDYTWLDSHVAEIDALVLGIGTPSARLRVAAELKARHPRVPWPPVIHPSVAIDHDSAAIGEGVMIGAGATLTVNVVLESFSMINFGATIGHESKIGPGVVVNPGANISGGVQVGVGALIGAGAVVLQYRRVGAGATVGAGAVVTKDVPEGVTVVGVPARARER